MISRLAVERWSYMVVFEGERYKSAISATKTLEVDRKRSQAHRVECRYDTAYRAK